MLRLARLYAVGRCSTSVDIRPLATRSTGRVPLMVLALDEIRKVAIIVLQRGRGVVLGEDASILCRGKPGTVDLSCRSIPPARDGKPSGSPKGPGREPSARPVLTGSLKARIHLGEDAVVVRAFV
jgi:hypothetical protein